MLTPTVKLGTIALFGAVQGSDQTDGQSSEAILALKPVTFRYKKEIDPDGIPQFGLIAEEVEKVNPDLVVRDEDGKVIHRSLRSGERDAAQ